MNVHSDGTGLTTRPTWLGNSEGLHCSVFSAAGQRAVDGPRQSCSTLRSALIEAARRPRTAAVRPGIRPTATSRRSLARCADFPQRLHYSKSLLVKYLMEVHPVRVVVHVNFIARRYRETRRTGQSGQLWNFSALQPRPEWPVLSQKALVVVKTPA